MHQDWFEMPEVRRRTLANSVWIPLRAVQKIEETGHHAHVGYKSEFYGLGSLAVPIENRQEAEKLGWIDIGIGHNHSGYFEQGKYIPADIYHDEFTGLHLVLDQRGNSAESSEWHLHQDLVTTLGIKREGDIWVRPDEGYIVVAKLSIGEDGSPYLLEVRASHLRDYLCAREMALYVTSYRNRVEVMEDPSAITWAEEDSVEERNGNDHWMGYVRAIHEGGIAYGEKIAVFHMARTDVDLEEDVPVVGPPTDANVASESWERGYSGRKLYRVEGELWRTEWIEPSSHSPIVRGDEISPTVSFITDAEGKQENRETLAGGGRWLWFRPEAMSSLAHRRGGSLGWYSRDTGIVGCSPDYSVHFGINSLGLINVYAKDIAYLPEWQQKIWAGYNVRPEGKVSEELLSSQVKAVPASTQAPEAFLADGISKLNALAAAKMGITLFRQHDQIPDLIARAHRFRVTDNDGLFALAKDLARLTADSIDVAALQKLVPPPKDTQWGSLKSLENVLATRIDPRHARAILSPLVGIYELRHADAHLASQDVGDALGLARVDPSVAFVTQGYQLLHSCVSSIYAICQVIEGWSEG